MTWIPSIDDKLIEYSLQPFAVLFTPGMNFQVGSVVDRRWDSVEEKARKQTKVREIFSAAWNGLLVSLLWTDSIISS